MEGEEGVWELHWREWGYSDGRLLADQQRCTERLNDSAGQCLVDINDWFTLIIKASICISVILVFSFSQPPLFCNTNEKHTISVSTW
jgi:hypothetical protein